MSRLEALRSVAVALAVATGLASSPGSCFGGWLSGGTSFPVEVIHKAASSKNCVSIVIVGDGWTQKEIDEGKYKKACERFKTLLMGLPPLPLYQHLIQITRIDVPSKDSGVTHEVGGKQRDTYYGTYFKRNPNPRPNPGQGHPDCNPDPEGLENKRLWFKDEDDAVEKVAKTNPSLRRNVVIVVSNDNTYGGAGQWFGAQNPGVCAVSMCPDAENGFCHELGHALLRLGDEYAGPRDPPATEPEQLNTTLEVDPDKVKWNRFIKAKMIGWPQMDGLNAHSRVFHPTQKCLMRTLDQKFCVVCQDAIVQRIYQCASLIESCEPKEGHADQVVGSGFSVRVQTASSSTSEIRGAWVLDGRKVEGKETRSGRGTIFEVTIPPDQLGPGRHGLSFFAVDRTKPDKSWDDGALFRMPSIRFWSIGVRQKGVIPKLKSIVQWY